MLLDMSSRPAVLEHSDTCPQQAEPTSTLASCVKNVSRHQESRTSLSTLDLLPKEVKGDDTILNARSPRIEPGRAGCGVG